MNPLILRGITWNHSRAFPPLIAASQRYEELHPLIRIRWDKRSLDDFGHGSLAELCLSYDLLVIDHPMLGEVYRDGSLLDLQLRLQSTVLDDLKADALGPCLDSYRFEGRLYALPLDAAAPAASFRPDLLNRDGRRPPTTWDQLIELARTGTVCMPGFPADLFLNFLGMCISRQGMIASRDQFLDPSAALISLEEMRELASLMPSAIFAMNPIDTYEAMTASDAFTYCPFAYTYSNYSRSGFSAHTLTFTNPVTLRDNIPLHTVLGGTGISISAGCAHARTAIDFCLFVTGKDCQSHIYGICGGQPASKAAWHDSLLNRASNDFFARTMASIESAHVRPRYAGYIGLQRTAGNVVAEYLHGQLTVAQALNQIEELYQDSLKNAAHQEGLA